MNSMRICYISLLILLGCSHYSFSESSKIDSIISISGQILQSESLIPIPLATIAIKRARKGIICDSLGIFHLQIKQYDTLRISALGYKPIDWEVPYVFNPDSPPFFQIKLEDISYLLNEVDIYALGTWDEFKEDFIKKDLPEDENIATTFNFGNLKLAQKEANSLKRDGGGFGFGIRFNKKAYKRIPRMEPLAQLHEQMLASKFNKELVADVTKESGERLDVLVKYINSKSRFTYRTSEYYIINKIKQLYQDFLQEKPQLKNNISYSDSIETIKNHLRP